MSILSRLDDPHYCLARAREARWRAEATPNSNKKQTLNELANDFLNLAKIAAKRRRSGAMALRLQQ